MKSKLPLWTLFKAKKKIYNIVMHLLQQTPRYTFKANTCLVEVSPSCNLATPTPWWSCSWLSLPSRYGQSGINTVLLATSTHPAIDWYTVTVWLFFVTLFLKIPPLVTIWHLTVVNLVHLNSTCVLKTANPLYPHRAISWWWATRHNNFNRSCALTRH